MFSVFLLCHQGKKGEMDLHPQGIFHQLEKSGSRYIHKIAVGLFLHPPPSSPKVFPKEQCEWIRCDLGRFTKWMSLKQRREMKFWGGWKSSWNNCLLAYGQGHKQVLVWGRWVSRHQRPGRWVSEQTHPRTLPVTQTAEYFHSNIISESSRPNQSTISVCQYLC